MNKEQLYKDLVKEYDELNEKINSLDAFINSLDFEDQVPDFIERELLRGKRQCMRNYRDNLKARIKCTEYQIKKEKNDRKALDEWMNMKGKIVNTLRGPVHLINTDEQHHCGQDAPHFDPNESQPVDLDDACCQAKNNASCPVGGGAAVVNEAQVPNSIKSLIGMLVVDAFHDTHKCTGCEYRELCNAKKVELVGGYFLCLEELPNSIVTE